jgi:NADP-dependent 3-hydroxy acid dehydrogenase YdfG
MVRTEGGLEGRSVLIAGGASGITAAARLFQEEGAMAMTSDLTQEMLEQAAADLRDVCTDVVGAAWAVRSMQDAPTMVQNTVDYFGCLRRLLCNVGMPRVTLCPSSARNSGTRSLTRISRACSPW